ncbi:hypothetical protein [Methylotuvimicrobium sp. KM2]|jgi:hypothetical protein|uniref:hypothetical protein n=1 Tax=Methylotuvimicrobium sp. KM2 TaxID=3133976 RepID=UPI003101156A
MKQIKAKFAVLLVYIDLPNSNEQDGELVKHIDALIKEAEDKSSAMCQDCGAAGTPKTNRNGWWVRVTCLACEEKRKELKEL